MKKVITKLAADMLNVKVADLNNLMYLTPRERKARAKQLLGISTEDLAVLKNIRRSPKDWALRELELTPMQYKRLLQNREEGEFEEVIEERIAKSAVLSNFGSLRSMLRGATDYWYSVKKKDTSWRTIEPMQHVISARDELDDMIATKRMKLISTYNIIISLYYAMYNASYGVKKAQYRA